MFIQGTNSSNSEVKQCRWAYNTSSTEELEKLNLAYIIWDVCMLQPSKHLLLYKDKVEGYLITYKFPLISYKTWFQV